MTITMTDLNNTTLARVTRFAEANGWCDFAQSLAAQVRGGRPLTCRQTAAFNRLEAKHGNPAPETAAEDEYQMEWKACQNDIAEHNQAREDYPELQEIGEDMGGNDSPPLDTEYAGNRFDGIVETLRTANANRDGRRRRPSLTVQTDDGQTVQLRLNGPASRYEGSVSVSDGEPFERNRFFGRINADGTWAPANNCPADVAATLRELAADVPAYVRRDGRATGRCCCCGRTLTDPNSIAAGIGPICADRFGL